MIKAAPSGVGVMVDSDLLMSASNSEMRHDQVAERVVYALQDGVDRCHGYRVNGRDGVPILERQSH